MNKKRKTLRYILTQVASGEMDVDVALKNIERLEDE